MQTDSVLYRGARHRSTVPGPGDNHMAEPHGYWWNAKYPCFPIFLMFILPWRDLCIFSCPFSFIFLIFLFSSPKNYSVHIRSSSVT